MPAFDPNSPAWRKLSLHGLRVDAQVGAFAEEHGRLQPLHVFVEAWVPRAQTLPRQDRLEEVFDYSLLRGVCLECVGDSHTRLLETMVDAMAERMLRFALVQAVRIRIEKPTAFADCESVSVEVFCQKEAA